MLNAYQCRTSEETVNAFKEIVQEVALLGLYRGGFFSRAAFYGGTALRVFHGLERFSEDLDFSLLEPDSDFDITRYFRPLAEELESYGFELELEERKKRQDSAIQSAFIKGGTRIHLMKLHPSDPPVAGIHPNQLLKIKLEVDTDPPKGGNTEVRYQLNPVPYTVRVFTLPTLFAGKLHALLARNWKSRVKGRDFYDYLWYLSKGIGVNLSHLGIRLVQSGHWNPDEPWNEAALRDLLAARFAAVDFEEAKKDVLPFIRDSSVLDLWSENFFAAVTQDKLKIAAND